MKATAGLIGGNLNMIEISRRAFGAAMAALMIIPGVAFAAEPLKEIRLDWATYNPVSIILKQNGLLETEFAKDGVKITWVQSAGSNKALEFQRRFDRFRIHRGFGRVAGKDQWQSDQVDLRLFAAGMD